MSRPQVGNSALQEGAIWAERLRKEVESITGFTMSAGVASNRQLAKLACGVNKPDAVTALSDNKVGLRFSLPCGVLPSSRYSTLWLA